MASRRGSNNSNFNSSFSRRTGGGGMGDSDLSHMSILGNAPVRRQNQSFGSSGYGGGSGSARGGDHYGGGGSQSRQASSGYGYSGSGSGRREDLDHYGNYDESRRPLSGTGGSGYQNVSFVTQGRSREEIELSPWTTRRSPSPVRRHANLNRGSTTEDSDRRRNTSSAWERGYEDSGNPYKSAQVTGLMQNSGLSMTGMNQNLDRHGNQQPVVMVVPQGQGVSQGGIMGMMPMPLTPSGQNPFNVLQRQTPMQVLLGNLPAFNSDAFGQHLLTAATNAQFGQAMGGSSIRQMGSHNQQRQGSNRQVFDRSGSDRSRIARQRSSHGAGTPSGRRPGTDSSRTSLVLRNGRGSISSTPSASQRGRKRGYSDRVNEVDRKRMRQSGKNGKNNRVARLSTGTGKTPQEKTNKKKTEDSKTATSTATPTKGSATKSKVEEGKTNEGKGDVDAAKINVEVIEIKETGKDVDVEKSEDADVKIVEEKPKKKSKYEDIPVELMVCKICQKTMNDAGSFESHLNGRAHQALARILEMRFQKRVDVLMADSKLNEEEIAIEIERQRRAGKQTQSGNKNKNFCKMCDCNYAVNWGTHKLSLGHRVLKEFLHPSCRVCECNFVQRTDYVKHLTDAGHLRKLFKLREEGKDLVEECSTTQDLLFSISLEMSKDEHVSNCLTIVNTNWKIPSKDDLKVILDNDTRDLIGADEEIVIPKNWDETVSYGTNAINGVNGFSCKICHTYIATEKDVELHCKSQSHFGMYCGFLRKLAKHREQVNEELKQADVKAAAEAEAKEKAKDAEVEKPDDDLGNGSLEFDGEGMEIIDEVGGDDTAEEMDADYNIIEDEVGGDDDDAEVIERDVLKDTSTGSEDVKIIEVSPSKGETIPKVIISTVEVASKSAPAASISAPAVPISAPAAPISPPATPISTPTTPIPTPATPISAPATPMSAPATPISAPATPISAPTVVPTTAAEVVPPSAVEIVSTSSNEVEMIEPEPKVEKKIPTTAETPKAAPTPAETPKAEPTPAETPKAAPTPAETPKAAPTPAETPKAAPTPAETPKAAPTPAVKAAQPGATRGAGNSRQGQSFARRSRGIRGGPGTGREVQNTNSYQQQQRQGGRGRGVRGNAGGGAARGGRGKWERSRGGHGRGFAR